MRLLPLCLLLCLAILFLGSGCSTGAANLKLEEMKDGDGVFFGHLDVYNGDQKIDNSGIYHLCLVAFEDENKETVANIRMDESGWIFSSAKAGKIYLVHVSCSDGMWGTRVGMKTPTRQLFFSVSPKTPTYFGNITLHFNYHDVPGLGMFGLVGAVAGAATASGSRDFIEMKIEDKFPEGAQEFQSRYSDQLKSFTNATIKQPIEKSSAVKE